jgi:hypothetical protein
MPVIFAGAEFPNVGGLIYFHVITDVKHAIKVAAQIR